VTWPAAFPVAKAYVDQLTRWGGMSAARLEAVTKQLAEAEAASGAARRTQLTTLAKALEQDARTATDAKRVKALAEVVGKLAAR
jgi:multidrug efflux pump subunit AcrA (membrane-fusion protein)